MCSTGNGMQNKHDDDDELDGLHDTFFNTITTTVWNPSFSLFVRVSSFGLFSTFRLFHVCVCARARVCVQRKARDSMVRKLFDFSHFHAKEKYQDALNWSLANAISKINICYIRLPFSEILI